MLGRVWVLLLCCLPPNGAHDGGGEPWWQRLGLPRPPIEGLTSSALIDAAIPASTRNRVAVNIGASDGISHDPTFELYYYSSYAGLLLECDEATFSNLVNNFRDRKLDRANVTTVRDCVNSSSILSHFAHANIPQDLDLLKIDIDATDFDLIKSLMENSYRPKIVVMEINADIPPPYQWHLSETIDWRYDNKGNQLGLYGVSADTLFSFLAPLGYVLVDIEFEDTKADCRYCEHNMWFIHHSFLAKTHHTSHYVDFVRLFWARRYASCLHIAPICPVDGFYSMGLENRVLVSLSLTKPENARLALHYWASISVQLKNLCVSPCVTIESVHNSTRLTSRFSDKFLEFDGKVLRAEGQRYVYLVINQTLRPFESSSEFLNAGYSFEKVEVVKPALLQFFDIHKS